jgi:hypothetical protein
MQSKRIRVPASRRADIDTRSIRAGSAVCAATLSQTRQALGAGPAWGRPATTVLVLAYGSAIELASWAGWLAWPAVSISAAAVGLTVLVLATRWCRGVDFNAWLQADSRHERGSCQWLIWRGERSGRPCLACLATMSRRERRQWLAAPSIPTPARAEHCADALPGRVRDAGTVPAGWLAWQALPLAFLLLATVQWSSDSPLDRRTALPLALAAVVTAAVNLRSNRARTTSLSAAARPVEGVCESCRTAPATATVRFADAATFAVCGLCLAAGVHPTAAGGDVEPSGRGVAR